VEGGDIRGGNEDRRRGLPLGVRAKRGAARKMSSHVKADGTTLRPELQPYVRHPKYLEEIRRAGLLVERVIQPELTRAMLVKHPLLSQLAPIGGPSAARQGTNFSVPPVAAELLALLVDHIGTTDA
jgi:hypothetical protein